MSSLFILKDILRQYPYHIDALFHLSDVSRMQDDTPTAVDLLGTLESITISIDRIRFFRTCFVQFSAIVSSTIFHRSW